MKEIFEQYGIQRLWHFTDASNLASIRKHDGLFSLSALTHFDIKIPEPGGNESSHRSDQSSGMDKYVHLSFVQDSPMLHIAQTKENRIPNPCWLAIDLNVAFVGKVFYCKGYANAGDAVLLTEEQAKQTIDFETLFCCGELGPHKQRHNLSDEKVREYNEVRKAEILIPNHIHWKNVINVIPA